MVLTASSVPSVATSPEQKEHSFSPGGRLLPSPGRFPLRPSQLSLYLHTLLLSRVIFLGQVGLVLSVPALYQEEAVDLQPSPVSSAYNHLHILHLVTMAHVVQVLLSSSGTTNNHNTLLL